MESNDGYHRPAPPSIPGKRVFIAGILSLLLWVLVATLEEASSSVCKTTHAPPAPNDMKIVFVKRAISPGDDQYFMRRLGFPANHESHSSLAKLGYDNEVVLMDLATGETTTLYRPEHDGFVGHLDLHWDGERLLFTQSNAQSWKIWEIKITGEGLRQISKIPDDVDCFDACYLPDGRIMAASNAPWQCVPCWHGTEQKYVANLYVMNAYGTAMRRLCFDQDHDIHPAVRHNGQVIFSRWDYTGINRKKENEPLREVTSFIKCLVPLFAVMFLASCATLDRTSENRKIAFPPQPLPGHPGNVFLEGETIRIPVPERIQATPVAYTIVDDTGSLKQKGAWPVDASSLSTDPLPMGWYRIEFLDAEGAALGWTSCAVLAELRAPIPEDSPVSLDTASAWFAMNNADGQKRFMSLAAMAGANWTRDRMTWEKLEPERGTFNEHETTYDSSADAAQAAGLPNLQVMHQTPKWARDTEVDGEGAALRFPRDLRWIYDFYRAMAERFDERVAAWEPWNEANISHFGGHTINEMCSLQKAAYLGLKAGRADVTVCWNVFAGTGSALHTEGIIQNETWPYFDTFNVHSYRAVDDYAAQMKVAHEAACGKPVWLTECGIRLKTDDERPWGDLDAEKELAQAEFVAKSYASSISAGIQNHFFFILGNYIERGVQFGLLRQDLTPRPAYVAFTAVGRLLAGARPLGAAKLSQEGEVRAYAFSAAPDGVKSDVLVLWATDACPFPTQLPATPRQAYDYLGREIPIPAHLTRKPVFLLFERDALQSMPLETSPVPAKPRDGSPTCTVMQVDAPVQATVLDLQAYRLPPGVSRDIPVWAYNFSDTPITGSVEIEEAPEAWRAELADARLLLNPHERKAVVLKVTAPAQGDAVLETKRIKLRGHFGASDNPVVSFRLCADRAKLIPSSEHAITRANKAEHWADNCSRNSVMKRRDASDGWVEITAKAGHGDAWVFPTYELVPGEGASRGCNALGLDLNIRIIEGNLRVHLREASGAVYGFDIPEPKAAGPFRTVVFFDQTRWGSYSETDPNGQLDPEQITGIMVGTSPKPDTDVHYTVKNLAWLEY